MKQKIRYGVLLFILFLCISVCFTALLRGQTAIRMIIAAEEESGQFRSMQMSGKTLEQLYRLHMESAMPYGQLLCTLFPETSGDFLRLSDGITASDCMKRKKILIKEARTAFERLSGSYGAAWDDVICMPVQEEQISYENTWMFERNYGGKRGHEGTDLIPPENLPGHFRVVSMTDGIIEQIGWLPKGGYRIGIRSPTGGYFYYAHLDSYARKFLIGEAVEAGEWIGMMGDTGYGPEGTRGKFAVHLHLGIYIRTDTTEELSVNPYWILRSLDLDTVERD